MRLRVSRTHHPVTTLGPGSRLGIWVQGCTIGCPGCISRDTWDTGGGAEVKVGELLAWCRSHDPDGITGVTITGGEPSEQAAGLTALTIALAEQRRRHGWDLMCYTGVEPAEFARRCPGVYATVDALMTGPYRVTEPTDLIWRGSANQRLIPLTPLGRLRYDRYVSARTDRPAIQARVDGEGLFLIGVPRTGDMVRLERLLAGRGVVLEGVSWRP